MDSFTTRPEIVGTFGVVSSTHWLASQTAMSILERGGNAFDAAVNILMKHPALRPEHIEIAQQLGQLLRPGLTHLKTNIKK